MLYIKKEGLPGGLNGRIIEIAKKEAWKQIRERDSDAIRQVFDNVFPKSEVKEVLLQEQHGLCAYCMRRISDDRHSRVEHIVPLSKNKERAIDYNNMLAVCDGGEQRNSHSNRVLSCDAQKGEQEISLSPLNKVQMDKIAYDREGRIYTEPKDAAMENDINYILQLNGIKKKDGSVCDTATELLKGRRDTYDRARRMLSKLNSRGKCTSSEIKKLMDKLEQSDEREEYVGVKLYYFRKKYLSLLKRGM